MIIMVGSRNNKNSNKKHFHISCLGQVLFNLNIINIFYLTAFEDRSDRPALEISHSINDIEINQPQEKKLSPNQKTVRQQI